MEFANVQLFVHVRAHQRHAMPKSILWLYSLDSPISKCQYHIASDYDFDSLSAKSEACMFRVMEGSLIYT